MKAKRSIYNFIFSNLSLIISFALGIIIPRLFIISLGSEANGLVSSIGQIFSYVGLLEAGIGATVTQALYKPIVNNDRTQINRILSASNRYYKKIGAIYIACVFVLAAVYPLVVNTKLPLWQVIAVVCFTGLGNAVNFLLQQNYVVLLSAEGKGYITTNLNTAVNVLSSLAKVFLLINGFNIVYIVGAQFVITLLRILLLRIYIGRGYRWLDVKQEPDKSALSKQRYVMVQQLSYFVFTNTDIVILTFFCNLTVVSIYTVYNIIIGVIEGVVSTFTSSVVFAMGQLYNEDFNKFKRIYKIYDSCYMTLVFALFSVVYLCIIPFLSVYTRGFDESGYLDSLLALLFVVLKMVTTLRSQSQNAINFAGHFKETQKSSVVEMVMNIVISLVAVYYIGIYGVVIGSIVSTLYKGISITNYANKFILKENAKERRVKYIRWIVYIFTFLIICFVSKSFISTAVNSYYQCMLLALICTVISLAIYFILWMFLDLNTSKDAFKLVKDILFKK